MFRFPLDLNEQFAEDLITTVARTVMNRLVGDYSFDEVIGAKRSDIAYEARHDSQRILDAYACGITVTALQMQRVIPPDRVKPAFDKVERLDPAKAETGKRRRGDAEQADSRGEGQPRQADPRGRGLRFAPQGRGERRDRGAPGQVSRLRARPEITRQRLYLEAMQDVLQGVKNKTIIDAELKQILPLLNLDAKGDTSR